MGSNREHRICPYCGGRLRVPVIKGKILTVIPQKLVCDDCGRVIRNYNYLSKYYKQ